ncbi:transcriptional regulator GcvA [Alphaproteobacteria bacterium HT1-32]|nr:transcriptional regulator GcvA [Alphaproteobacteria bacterium HT1-32]
MARRLPPLNALRAFEAGARHLSFTRASEELYVTQAAVSHQVKTLEEALGVKLFKRLPRKLILTDEGRALLPAVSEAFAKIADAADRITAGAQTQILNVTLTPAFAAKWLTPRFSRFWQNCPDIDLRLHHSISLVDFAREDMDMGVRAGRGEWPGLEAEFLLPIDLTPVCSPALLEGENPLREPSDLRHHTLLHEDNQEDWVQWIRLAGLTDVDPRSGRVFNDSPAMIQVALDGRGVALGRTALITGDLESGRLVKPFDLELSSDIAYYIIYPPGSAALPKVQAFREFLLEEAAIQAAG